MLEDIRSVAGEDEARGDAAAVADAERAEWRVEKGDIRAGDSLGD